MVTKTKKALSVLLAFVFALSMCNIVAFADGDAVAEVGNTEYTSLAEAIAAANSGDTIELLVNFADAGTIYLPAGVTLDGNSHTISGNSAVYINAAGGTVQDVNFEGIHNTASLGNYVNAYPGINVGRDSDVGTLTALYANGLSGTATVSGCTFDNVDWEAIQMTPVAGATINITGNTFKHTDAATIQLRYVHIQSAKNVDFTATVSGNKFYNGSRLHQTGLEVYYPVDAEKIDLSGNYMAEPMAVCIGTGGTSYNNATAEAFPFKDENLENDVTVVASILDENVGNFLYTSLASAAAAAENGDTITMLANSTESDEVVFDVSGANFALDLAGYTVTVPGDLWVKNGSLTITSSVAGGTVVNNSGVAIYVSSNYNNASGALTINSGNVTVHGSDYGIAFMSNSTLNIGAGTITGNVGISGNGTSTGAQVNISGGTISGNNLGIYFPGSNALNISGGTISGNTGAYIKSGTTTITGGIISGNGTVAAYTYNNNGANSTGDAIVIDNCNYPSGAPTANISGATITSANGNPLGYYVYNSSSEGTVLSDTAYTLSTNTDKTWVAYNDETYSYTIAEYVEPVTKEIEVVDNVIPTIDNNSTDEEIAKVEAMNGAIDEINEIINNASAAIDYSTIDTANVNEQIDAGSYLDVKVTNIDAATETNSGANVEITSTVTTVTYTIRPMDENGQDISDNINEVLSNGGYIPVKLPVPTDIAQNGDWVDVLWTGDNFSETYHLQVVNGYVTVSATHFSDAIITKSTTQSSFVPVAYEGNNSATNSVFRVQMNLQDGLYITYTAYIADDDAVAHFSVGSTTYDIDLSTVDVYDSNTYNAIMRSNVVTNGYYCAKYADNWYYFTTSLYPNRMNYAVSLSLTDDMDNSLSLYENTGNSSNGINNATLYSLENNTFSTSMLVFLTALKNNSSNANTVNIATTLLNYYTNAVAIYGN